VRWPLPHNMQWPPGGAAAQAVELPSECKARCILGGARLREARSVRGVLVRAPRRRRCCCGSSRSSVSGEGTSTADGAHHVRPRCPTRSCGTGWREAGWSGAGQAAGLSGVIPPEVWGMAEILRRRQPPESITPQISFVWSLRRPRVASCKKLPIVSEFQTQSTQDQPLRTLNLFLRQRGLQCGPAAMDDLKDALKVSLANRGVLDDIKARIRAEVFSVIESETVRTRSLRAALSLPGPSCSPCRAGGLTRPHATRPRTSGSQTRRARCS
jgi:hypothetical protein